jgi:hypothetical protein
LHSFANRPDSNYMLRRIHPSPSPTGNDFIRRGRRVGAALALGMTFVSFCTISVLGGGSASQNDRLALGFVASLAPALLAAFGGTFLGELATICPTTTSAFVRGAVYPVLVAAVLGVPFLPFIALLRIQWSRDAIPLLCLSVPLPVSGALVAGIAAIYIRDYRESQRKRWIPQITIQEMLIVFTLITVIISAATSLRSFRP